MRGSSPYRRRLTCHMYLLNPMWWPCPSGYGLALRRDECTGRCRLEAATPVAVRQVGVQKLVCRNLHTLRRVASSIRPRLLVEDNDASHSLRESWGGLGMVLSLAKHVPRPSHKPRAVLAAGQPVMGECLLPQARVYPRAGGGFPASAGTSPFRAGPAKLPVIVTPAN